MGNGWRRRSPAPPPMKNPVLLRPRSSARASERGRRALGRDGLAGRDGGDRDLAAATAEAEGHRTRDEREQRVVLTPADAETRVEVGATLADDDLAGLDDLATEALDAQALGVGVAAVAGRRSALLVCHVVSPS